MDFLKAEIERKKRQIESSNVLAPNKKFFKREDLLAKQEQEYWKKHGRLKENDGIKNKDNGDLAPTNTNSDERREDDTNKFALLSRKEVIRLLREREEPITLFGETEFEAFQRLKRLETLEPGVKKGEGFSNDFKAAMDKVDQDYLNELIKSGGTERSNDVSVKDDGTTVEDIEKMKNDIGNGETDKDQDCILRFLKYILKAWGKNLNSRPEEEKMAMKGKMASATHSQTVSYMKPIFRKLKQKKVQEDILVCLTDIVKHLMDRDYIMANHAYMEMAIGNAPWPIGVTMVGIHARTGREKISSRYVAHVLNDETQRKYIQGLKRLMSQCQRIFPTDPSRSVNYEKT